MPVWLIVILVIAVIGAIIGFCSGDDGERGVNAAAGAFAGAMGCIYFLFQIVLSVAGLIVTIMIFKFIFC